MDVARTDGERLVRIETMVKNLDEKFTEFLNYHRDGFKDHENRIRALERKTWILAGIAAVAGATGRELLQFLGG